MKYRVFGICLCITFHISPAAAFAAVIINEIAWMGTSENFRCEWIELHNNGNEPVDMSEWAVRFGENGTERLFASGEYDSLVIESGGYFVIGRLVPSCPNPVNGLEDLLLAFGDLPNTNTIVIVSRPDDEVDRVASGENWTMGGSVPVGNNTTKETAQWTPQGWTTGAPTPRTANVPYTAPQQSGGSSGSGTSSSSSSGTSSDRPLARQVTTASAEKLSVAVTGPSVTYVNQPVTFTAAASGLTPIQLSTVKFDWSFGDLSAAYGDEVTHAYAYPGTYLLILSAKRLPEHEVELRREVEVLPVALSLARTSDGDLTIESRAEHAIDISGYRVHAGGATYTVPPQTILLPGAAITLPRSAFQAAASGPALLADQTGVTVAMYPSVGGVQTTSVTTTSAAVAPLVAPSVAEESSEPPPRPMAEPEPQIYALRAGADAVAQGATASSSSWVPYAGLAGVIALGLVALFAWRT